MTSPALRDALIEAATKAFMRFAGRDPDAEIAVYDCDVPTRLPAWELQAKAMEAALDAAEALRANSSDVSVPQLCKLIFEDYAVIRSGDETKWFVVDVSKAEPEVNWPGELISEHNDFKSARIALVDAALKAAMLSASPQAKGEGDV